MTTIRLVEEKDSAGILNIYAPYVLETAVTFELEVPSLEVFWERAKKNLAEAPFLVCEIDGQIAGYAYASRHRSRGAYQWTRELSVYVHPHFRKRKIATALYLTIIQLLKLQNFRNALAGITMPNRASILLHEHLGFELVGTYNNIGYKLGKSHQVSWWERTLIPSSIPMVPIKTMQEVVETAEWQEQLKSGIRLIRD
ncbi:MAG: N-acetyltransferase [Aureispira sp.]|nr:N-acetyltransferase [Aureispira sp.]